MLKESWGMRRSEWAYPKSTGSEPDQGRSPGTAVSPHGGRGSAPPEVPRQPRPPG